MLLCDACLCVCALLCGCSLSDLDQLTQRRKASQHAVNIRHNVQLSSRFSRKPFSLFVFWLSSGYAFPFLVPVCACVSAPHLTLGTNPFGTHSQLPASVDSSWIFFLSSSNDFRYSTPFLMLLCDGCTFLPASVCVRASLWMQSQ